MALVSQAEYLASSSKYSIRLRETVMGGLRPMLCDEAGLPLPNQRGVTIVSKMDDVMTATVEFVVGGELPILQD